LNQNEKAALLREELGADVNCLMPPTDDDATLKIICLDDVEQEPVRWLWEPYIPLGKITILGGDPGLGKTFFGTRLTAIVSSGGSFPVGEGVFSDGPGNVIFQTAEDGLGDTIKARLVDAEADCSRVFVIDETNASLSFDDYRLREAMVRLHPSLLIIDPLQAYIGPDVDLYRANEVRPVMAQLGALAAEFQCAIVLIGHHNKMNGGKSLYRGLGSIDLTAAARSVLAIGEVPEQKFRRAVVQVKSSLAPAGKTILFDLDPSLGFLWAGTSDLTADDVLNYQPPAVERKAPRREEAENFLREILKDGVLKSADIKKEARERDITAKSLREARENLKIDCFKGKGEDQSFFWRLPLQEYVGKVVNMVKMPARDDDSQE